MKNKDKTANYKPAVDREKDLRLAIYRIEGGRAHTKETKLTIAAVARETGVSTALIHNHYPKIAETIRQKQGRSSRAMRDVKHQDLIVERLKSADYRQEIEALRAKLASGAFSPGAAPSKAARLGRIIDAALSGARSSR